MAGSGERSAETAGDEVSQFPTIAIDKKCDLVQDISRDNATIARLSSTSSCPVVMAQAGPRKNMASLASILRDQESRIA